MTDIPPFCSLRPDLGTWNPLTISNDISNLLELAGEDFDRWKRTAITGNGKVSLTMNLTSTPAFSSWTDRLWKYSGARYYYANLITERDLSTPFPELKGTHLGDLIDHVTTIFGGSARVRLHNRVATTGMFWHLDKDGVIPWRVHMALWTNYGHFLVWIPSSESLQWRPGFHPDQTSLPHDIRAEYIPDDGIFRQLQTADYVHGVANIGVGKQQSMEEQTRCHLVIYPT